MPRLPWRKLVGWTFLGVVLSIALVLWNVAQSKDSLGTFVDTTPTDVSAPIFAAEVGPEALKAGGEHDGHYFYLIARAPMHLDASVPYLDRPGYRLGRPVMPWLAWALHPSGGGWGLVWALFAVGVGSLVLGGLGTGALSVTLGGQPWPAVVFPLAVGSWLSLRISVPDPLALAFALWAVVLLYRRHLLGAVLMGMAAGLTKESALLLFVGVLLARRDRPSVVLLGSSGAAIVAWQLWLRMVLDDVGKPVDEIGVPLAGVLDALRLWFQGFELLGMLTVVGTVVLAVVVVVKRGLSHPLTIPVLVQLAFVAVLSPSVLAPERNGSRAVLPLMALAIVMAATPRAAKVLAGASRVAGTPVGHRDPTAVPGADRSS